MKTLLIIFGLVIFVAVFVPSACSSEKRQSVVSPDRHEFPGLKDFVAKYGRADERAWALGNDEKKEGSKRAAKPSSPRRRPAFHGF